MKQTIKIKSNQSIINFWVCCVLLPCNIYGDYFQKITGINPSLITLINIFVFISAAIFLKPYFIIDKRIVLYCIANVVLLCFHTFTFYTIPNEFKNFMYIILFVFSTCYLNESTFYLVKKILYLITAIMTIDVLVQARVVIRLQYRIFNVRRFTMLDKPWYTLLFAVTGILLFNIIIENRSYLKKIVSIIAFAIQVGILTFIIESKMALLAIGFAIFAEFLFAGKIKRRKIFSICFLLGGIVILYLILFCKELPDYLIALLSILNDKQVSTVNSVYYQTYDLRLEIVKLVLQIFQQYPVLGCGFGNYPVWIVQSIPLLSLGITDVESSVLAMLAEGGLFYLMINILLLGGLFLKIKQNRTVTLDYLGVLSVLICLIAGNDFVNVFYWIVLAILWNIPHNNSSRIIVPLLKDTRRFKNETIT